MDAITKMLPFDTHMDYAGQELAERLFQYIIAGFTLVGLLWGYYCQEFEQTVYVLAAGIVLAALLCLPPWPMYRRQPLYWLKKPK